MSRRILPPPSDDEGRPRLTALTKLSPGSLPIPLVPWSVIVARRRIAASAQARDRFASIALAIVLVAMFMVNLSVTAIAVAVPRIADDFAVADSAIVWAVTGPILVSAILGPTFGKLGDQRGHRTIFLGGILVNAVFTLLIAASQTAVTFIAFRLLAAVGSAAIGPSALAFINRLFEPRDRAGALGWWSFVGAGSPVIGLVAGGYLIDAVGWRAVFLIQAPLVLAAAVLAGLILPQTTRQRSASFDLPGAATLGVGIGAVLLAVTLASTEPVSVAVVLSALVGAGALWWFARIERASPEPLIPPHYWRMRRFVVPTVTLALLFAAYMGSFVLAPLMLQSVVFGFTAKATTSVIIARPLCFSIAGPLTGYLSGVIEERKMALFGAVSIVISMIVLSRYEPGMSSLVAAAGLGLAGIGMGAAAPVLTASVANAVDDADLGVAGAAQQMLQQVGLVIGVQVLQAVQAVYEGDAVPDDESAAMSVDAVDRVIDSYHLAFAAATGLALLGLFAALSLPRASDDEASRDTVSQPR